MLNRRKIREIRRGTGYGISIEKPWRPEKGAPDPLAKCTTVLHFPTDVALAVGGPAQRHTIRCRNLSPRRSREQRPGSKSQMFVVKTLGSRLARGQGQAQTSELEGENLGNGNKTSCSSLKDPLGPPRGELHVFQGIPVARGRPKSQNSKMETWEIEIKNPAAPLKTL